MPEVRLQNATRSTAEAEHDALHGELEWSSVFGPTGCLPVDHLRVTCASSHR